MGTEERKLEDILGEKFQPFEESLKTYLKEQKLTKNWEDYISGLSFKLCVWISSDTGQGDCLPGKENPFMLSSSGVVNLKSSEDKEDKASYFYGQICQKFPDSYLDRIHKNEAIYYNAFEKQDIQVGQYKVLWIISCEKKHDAAQEFIIKVILELLNKYTDDLSIIEKADKDFWGKKVDEFNIMENYMKLVFKIGKLPDSKTITKIAWRNYEKKENKSKLLFLGEREKRKCTGKDDGILLFDDGNHIEIVNHNKIGEKEDGSIGNIRKMLETCSQRDSGGCYLLAENTTESYPLFGIITEDALEKLGRFNDNYWLIEFTGKGGWSLLRGSDVVLIYQKGEFFINLSQEQVKIDNELGKIRHIKDEKKEIFEKILTKLREQKHGALLIISDDAENEAKILCRKFRRGTLVDRVDFSKEDNLPLLDGIAAVDGAVLVDFSGICYGFGVILDGQAKAIGDVSRGARFNSALNYVAGKERCAVVVSEDKENGIKIVQGEEIEVLSRDVEKD